MSEWNNHPIYTIQVKKKNQLIQIRIRFIPFYRQYDVSDFLWNYPGDLNFASDILSECSK